MTLNISAPTIHKDLSNHDDREYRIGRGEYSSLVHLLEHRAYHQADNLAYHFLDNGETGGKSITYRELAGRAKGIGKVLKERGARGERALLVYSPGLDFIGAFFGCLYAGVIAVPIYPPKRNQSRERLLSIVTDSGATIALTTGTILEDLAGKSESDGELSGLNWIATDTIEPETDNNWRFPDIQDNNLAFLQYTSGSTGVPKGVMVSHSNIIHNCEQIYRAFGHNPVSRGVIWLPLYHDMGLIGGVLQPLYGGFPVHLMSPVDFLQKPLRWLEAISKFKATTSGGPNFAYDVCIKKVTPEQVSALDLSSWDLAFTGAEPIRAETLEEFAKKFAPCGFRKEAFYPCYGMAEATLFITGGIKNRKLEFETIDEEALTEGRAIEFRGEGGRTLVGCGKAWLDQTVIIVNPDTFTPCEPKEVGEIWVSGDSIAAGYWNQPEKTGEAFLARLENSEQNFLRTGDLGFLREDGELFITGRLKDVIIIRGRNHYPQDIEKTVESAHIALIPHRSAAFTVNIDGQEKLMVAVEVERRFRERRQAGSDSIWAEKRKAQRRDTEHIDPGFEVELEGPPIFEEITRDVRRAVSSEHGLQVHSVLLLRVGTIPKTSSGKIQRYACRQGYLENTLTLVYNPGS